MGMTPPDCTRCGACCRDVDTGIETGGIARLGEHKACEHLRLSPEGFACAIYEERPKVCRQLFHDKVEADLWCDECYVDVFKGKRPLGEENVRAN